MGWTGGEWERERERERETARQRDSEREGRREEGRELCPFKFSEVVILRIPLHFENNRGVLYCVKCLDGHLSVEFPGFVRDAKALRKHAPPKRQNVN